jgi:hypothetical protein
MIGFMARGGDDYISFRDAKPLVLSENTVRLGSRIVG